jgi:pimeloyl-ACP methyl ester carboxylesterase
MPIASINGLALNYEVSGWGEAVVFLHGYTGSMQDWANQIPVLSPRYKVVTIDHRGHGKSAAPSREEDYSVKLLSDDAFGLLDLLNIKKCCLVGHSLGGFTALQFAVEHPDRLAGLVLVDTSSGQFARDPNYAQLRQKLDELARTQGMAAAFEYDAANNPMRIERFKKHPELRETSRQKVLQTSVDGYIYMSRAIGRWQPLTSRLSEIKVPTIIFWGDEDTPFEEPSRIMKKAIAGSQLVKVKGSGHSPHEEAPEAFNKALLRFLSRIKW